MTAFPVRTRAYTGNMQIPHRKAPAGIQTQEPSCCEAMVLTINCPIMLGIHRKYLMLFLMLSKLFDLKGKFVFFCLNLDLISGMKYVLPPSDKSLTKVGILRALFRSLEIRLYQYNGSERGIDNAASK